jgi:hypothetical protein
MKRALLLTSLLLALAACSGHTVHRLEVDLLSFVPPGNRTGTLDITQVEIRVPDDPAGQEVPVPGAEALVDGRISLRVGLTNPGTLPANVDLEVRMGPKDDTNLYDGNKDIQVIPFYANAFVLGHQWNRVCRLRVSGSWARTRHRSATTSIISSRSRKYRLATTSFTRGHTRSTGWSSGE